MVNPFPAAGASVAGHWLIVAGKRGARHGAYFGHAAQIDSCSSDTLRRSSLLCRLIYIVMFNSVYYRYYVIIVNSEMFIRCFLFFYVQIKFVFDGGISMSLWDNE